MALTRGTSLDKLAVLIMSVCRVKVLGSKTGSLWEVRRLSVEAVQTYTTTEMIRALYKSFCLSNIVVTTSLLLQSALKDISLTLQPTIVL